jgi:hypothetical protein
MEVLDEWAMWNLVSLRLGIVLVSVQMVCSECAIGSEIILDAPDDTTRCEAQVEACLSPFGDSAILDAR